MLPSRNRWLLSKFDPNRPFISPSSGDHTRWFPSYPPLLAWWPLGAGATALPGSSHKQQRLQSLQNLGKYSLLLLLSSWASSELVFNWKLIFQSLWHLLDPKHQRFSDDCVPWPLESSLVSIVRHLWASQQHMWQALQNIFLNVHIL